ncbi:unnamed protein product [Caenorhabditis auriculariae]|uniref:Uncharacterized protein n=1 Tax=Caenorhabditis auriculariae TaxID=2777116 RepID=A0A8S1HPI0_9PELO|nr:unnamed protein product [Caenorhabditis auriculariae]
MLNHEDVSEYLKIGPNGLEARCDVSSFESVRCTFEVQDGVWYYEATVLTPGVMQIGLATKRSRFLNHEGYGIGDDESSVAYDGCRQLIWHNAVSTQHEHRTWVPGDVIGVLLNIPEGFVQFYLNGVPLNEPHTTFLDCRLDGEGVFAAASFMSFQQCRFNFGAQPFDFPPAGNFFNFNEDGPPLSQEKKTIIPRKQRLELLMRETVPDDFCTICFSAPGNMKLLPCNHSGFCETCTIMLDLCPLCRGDIDRRVLQETKEEVMSISRVSDDVSRSSATRKSQQRVTPRRATIDTVVVMEDGGSVMARRDTQV